MGFPAARKGDMHLCLKTFPAGPIQIPHIGGPINGPGIPTVKIGGMEAAVKDDMCSGGCELLEPGNKITKGSVTVKIGGKPAARMLDTTKHGGFIILGCFTVMIGG